MISNLIVACGLACGVALPSQNRSISSTLVPSRAITSETTFNVGDIVFCSYDFDFSTDISFELFSNSDSGINSLRFLSYNVNYDSIYYNGVIPFDFDYADIYFGSHYDSSLSPSTNFGLFDLDNDIDIYYSLSILNVTNDNLTLHVTLTFEILEGFEGFNSDCFPYLNKVENPYTPPAKSNLYRLLYDFYYSIFNDDDLSSISTDYNMPFDNWLAHTCTIVTLITLIVVVFFFLRWLFKVVSGLILLKH